MNRRTYSYRRGPRYAPARRRGAGDRGIRLGPLLLCGLLLLAVYLRFSPGETPQAVRQTVASLLEGELSLKDAVMVFGQQIAGGSEEDEGVLQVFKNKLLGEDGEEQAPEAEPDVEEYEVPASNHIQEVSPDEEENTQTAGLKTGRLFLSADGLLGVCESPYPAIDPNTLRFEIQEGEEMDDTPNEPFTIPSPDVVDDNTYDLPFVCMAPVKGRITSPFGYRDHPIDEEVKFHYGVDVALNKGSSIACLADGTVIDAGTGNVYGNYVRVDHGGGFTSFYGHMDSISVQKGQTVKQGTEIGKVGSTGKSTGPHLHFEMRTDGKIIDPTDYVELAA